MRRDVAALLAVLATPVAALTEAETLVLPRLIHTPCFNMVGALNGCETVLLLAYRKVSLTPPI